MEILQPATGPIGALCYLPAARTGVALRPPAMRGGPLVITINSSTAITIDTRRTASTPCRTAGGLRSPYSRVGIGWIAHWPTPTSAWRSTSTSPRSSTCSKACTPDPAKDFE